MSDAPPILALDLGGTHLRAGIVQAERLDPVLTIAHGAGFEQPLAMERLVSWVWEAVAGEPIAAIGVSVAGTVIREHGVVAVADNLGWRNAPLAALLAAAFGVPVSLETDTFCGARAEAQLGGAPAGAVLYVAIGTGIGHAWILDGRVWRGARGAASLGGHLVIHPEGRPCYCGNRGCLCQYAAGPVVRPALPADRGMGDPQALAEASQALALALAQAVTLMNPTQVILGGGAVSVAWPDPRDLAERVARLVHPEVRPIRIRHSALGERANLLGAGLLFLDGRGAARRGPISTERS